MLHVTSQNETSSRFGHPRKQVAGLRNTSLGVFSESVDAFEYPSALPMRPNPNPLVLGVSVEEILIPDGEDATLEYFDVRLYASQLSFFPPGSTSTSRVVQAEFNLIMVREEGIDIESVVIRTVDTTIEVSEEEELTEVFYERVFLRRFVAYAADNPPAGQLYVTGKKCVNPLPFRVAFGFPGPANDTPISDCLLGGFAPFVYSPENESVLYRCRRITETWPGIASARQATEAVRLPRNHVLEECFEGGAVTTSGESLAMFGDLGEQEPFSTLPQWRYFAPDAVSSIHDSSPFSVPGTCTALVYREGVTPYDIPPFRETMRVETASKVVWERIFTFERKEYVNQITIELSAPWTEEEKEQFVVDSLEMGRFYRGRTESSFYDSFLVFADYANSRHTVRCNVEEVFQVVVETDVTMFHDPAFWSVSAIPFELEYVQITVAFPSGQVSAETKTVEGEGVLVEGAVAEGYRRGTASIPIPKEPGTLVYVRDLFVRPLVDVDTWRSAIEAVLGVDSPRFFSERMRDKLSGFSRTQITNLA